MRFDCSATVSWGGLTSSKLQAPRYDEAAKREPTTDHRIPTTNTRKKPRGDLAAFDMHFTLP